MRRRVRSQMHKRQNAQRADIQRDKKTVKTTPSMQTLKSIRPERVGKGPLLVFCHANGYPPEAYSSLLSRLPAELDIRTVEHRPFWQEGEAPRFLSWQTYADDLAATLARENIDSCTLMGHSMGAVVSFMVALEQPERVQALVALDPVLLNFAIWVGSRVTTRLLRRDIPIAIKAERRPSGFDGHQAAYEFYQSKRAFQRMGSEQLWDYVRSAHSLEQDGSVSLRWSGAWEACVYRSAPYMMSRLKKLRVPLLGIAGAESDVLNPQVLADWQRACPALNLHVLDAGHLVPLEEPDACGELITEFLVDAGILSRP